MHKQLIASLLKSNGFEARIWSSQPIVRPTLKNRKVLRSEIEDFIHDNELEGMVMITRTMCGSLAIRILD